MDNMETENDELISRLNHLEKVTLNRLHRLLNSIDRTIRQQDLSFDAYNQLKPRYENQIENMSEQAQDLSNDISSDLATRTNRIRQLEQQALTLEENIRQIPESIRKYQPEEGPEPDESEEQMGGRRKHRKSRKHRKTKHHKRGGKRKSRHNRKKTRRHRY